MEDVIKYIKSLNIYEDDNVVLACSYGPDSMCLLDILKKLNINVIVAHVNHKYRKESDKEYNDLKKYCEDNNLSFEGKILTEEVKGNREEFYRKFRYDFFAELVKKYQAKYLFTAHHGDDLVETVLMRLSRGASFKGYAGFNIRTKINDYEIIRPLILVTKDDILKYIDENNIPYAIDATNLENIYTRNKYRNEILPILKEINPDIHKKFIKFSHLINEYSDYLDNETNNLYSKLYINNHLDLNEFNLYPLLLRKELLKKVLFNIYEKDINRINDTHLGLIFDLIDNDKKNSFINLPNNLIVRKYYNIIEFVENTIKEDYDLIFDNEIIKDNRSLLKVDTTDIIKSNYLIRLNSTDIKLPLHVRNRKVQDKIELKNGTKKVGEILSEAKMPKHIRDIYPIVTDDKGKILWIPGVKKSKFDKQINEDYDIIIKYIKKERKNEK